MLGAGVYASHWPKSARTYVQRHTSTLARLPVWLFSSGPLGDATVDEQCRDLRRTNAPAELQELQDSVHPREHRVFFGALDPGHPSLPQKALRVLPAGRALLPAGDFRDWEDIDGWAARIVDELTAAGAPAVAAEPTHDPAAPL